MVPISKGLVEEATISKHMQHLRVLHLCIRNLLEGIELIKTPILRSATSKGPIGLNRFSILSKMEISIYSIRRRATEKSWLRP